MPRACLVAGASIRGGKFRLADRPAFDAACQRFPDCRLVVRVEEHKDPISEALRGYYFGVVLRHISAETGYDDRDAHLEMKKLHFPLWIAALRGIGRTDGLRVFDASIKNISNEESWEYLENIQRFAAERLDGLVIPDPNQHLVAVV